MAIARYSFLPWLRRGIANQIQAAASGAPRAEMDAVLTLETRKAKAGSDNQLTDTATQKLRLIGPGDITGINKNMVVRTEPRNWITDFEPNYLAFIEFYDEDFPWRYTPAPPGANHLAPWIALMVLKDSEFERVTMPGRPLPAIKLKGANWQNFLPPADKTWAWAHVHINEIINNAALTDHDFSEADRSALERILKNNPDAGIARLVSPRHLEPKTPYRAFVIPAFEVGRKAGLGIEVKDTDSGTASSWTNGQIEFPYYYEWFFRTSEAGDFETLVRRLVPRDMDSRVGIRNMDVQQPGYGVNDVDTQYTDPVTGVTHPEDIAGLEGALKAPTTRSIPLSADSDFEEKVEPVINQQFVLLDEIGDKPDEDPTIAPPLYGMWHAMAKKLSIKPEDAYWVNELNQAPSHRTEAGMGTAVVQKNQESYMRSAWQQVGSVLEMNRKIHFTQLSMWVSQMMYDKHLKKMVPERTFLLTTPVHSKIKGSPFTIKYLTRTSRLPQATGSGAFRKMARPKGLMAKRLLAAGDFSSHSTTFIRKLNDGSITAAPPLILPKETPTTGVIVDSLKPATPGGGPSSAAAKKALWRLIAIILLLLVVILRTSNLLLILASIALMIIAFVRYWRFTKGGQLSPAEKQKEEISESFKPENMTPEAVAEVPPRTSFELAEPGVKPTVVTASPPTGPGAPPDPAIEVEVAKKFRVATEMFHGEIQVEPPPEPEPQPLDFDNAYLKVMTTITPAVAFPKRVVPQLQVGGFSYRDYIGRYHDGFKFPLLTFERIVEVMAYPHFKQPMYEPLRDISTELFVPNLNLIPSNTLSLMVTNMPFIESYMVGLNHEFSRELLWREYPTDQRGSYFRQFWDVKGVPNTANLPQKDFEEKLKDIPEIHLWGSKSNLGDHNHREAGGDKEQLVLVIRGDLLKRYPNTIIYAMRAKWDDDPNHPNRLVIFDETGENLSLSDPNILYPLYKAQVKPDITFLGFDLTIAEAKGDGNLTETEEARTTIPANKLGWFFVIKEVPGEPRFGLDEETTTNLSPEKWDNLSWQNLGNDVALIDATTLATQPGSSDPPNANPNGVNWNSNAADLAYILYQKPVLVAVHAREMLKNLE
jgi:hypothetical protein